MKINLTDAGNGIKAVRPDGRLGQAAFGSYLAAVKNSGARFDRADRRWTIPEGAAETFTRLMAGHGFEVVAQERKPRRTAETAVETWAAEGIQVVAGMDPDRARVLNGVGFSAYDGEIGHSLAEQLSRGNGLTAGQWGAALKLARKYRKQIEAAIGTIPEADAVAA